MLSLRIADPVPAQEPRAVHPDRRRHRRRHRRAGLPRLAHHQPADEPGRPDHRQQSPGRRAGEAGRAAGRLHAAAEAGDGGPERDHDRRADARVLGDLPQGRGERAAPVHRRRARPAGHDLRHLGPAGGRRGVSGRRRGARRQGLRRHVRAQARRRSDVRAALRQAGQAHGGRRLRLRLGRGQQRDRVRQRRRGGDRARARRPTSTPPIDAQVQDVFSSEQVAADLQRANPRSTASRSPSGRRRTPTCSPPCRARAPPAT